LTWIHSRFKDEEKERLRIVDMVKKSILDVLTAQEVVNDLSNRTRERFLTTKKCI